MTSYPVVARCVLAVMDREIPQHLAGSVRPIREGFEKVAAGDGGRNEMDDLLGRYTTWQIENGLRISHHFKAIEEGWVRETCRDAPRGTGPAAPGSSRATSARTSSAARPGLCSCGSSPRRVARLQGPQTGRREPSDEEMKLMPLTRSFKATVQARAANDPAFREALFQEAVQALLAGDAATGRTALRDYINATIGFDALAKTTGVPPKSLMRMFGPSGNPQARRLIAVLEALQRATGVRLEVRVVSDAA